MKRMIGLNAGHGGRDRGCSQDGLVEKDLSLDIACLSAAKLGWSTAIEPLLIRSEDINLTNDEVAGIAKRFSADAVIDIHFNESSYPGRDGGEVYHRRGDSLGRALGIEVFAAMPEREWRTWRSDFVHNGEIACPGAFAVTEAYDPIPCALLEIAFLSSASDRRWLKTEGVLDQIATAVAQGCESWVASEPWRNHEQRY